MSILKVVLTILEALLALNLLIFVHELGHFLAARWRGMQVDRFAIWFGKPVWKKKINGVEYALGWIPAGGYVALPQMATMEMLEGKSDDDKPLPNASALDKIIVAFAGPLFSFLLAVFFAFVVWGVGRPEQLASDKSTTLGYVDPTGPAYEAGLRPGDRILEVDGHPVTQFSPPSQDSITWRIVTSEGSDIAIKYQRGGKEMPLAHVVPIKEPTKWYERKSLRKIKVAPIQPAIVGDIITNSPAAVADLKVGDEIVALDGQPIYSYYSVWDLEKTNVAVKPVTMTVKRGTNQFDSVLLAEKPLKPADASQQFGILWQVDTNETITHPSPAEQIGQSAGQIFGTLRTVFSPKSDVGLQQLGGPVLIIRAYKNFLDSANGWRRVLWFSVILNVNLALLNMFPLPVLDGGHILLSLLEVVRRRPVNAKVILYIQNACAIILISFMLFIAFFDTGDWIRSSHNSGPIEFKAK